MTTDLRKWLAFGTGVGIEVRADDLYISVVRARPSESGVLGSATVTTFRSRPASEWGNELTGFLRKVGAAHVAPTVLLPRREVIIRQLSLPGVADKDLASAVQLQMDSLHPFADEDVYFSWTRIGKSPTVLVGIARREVVDHYSSLFDEAGVKVASFTFSAAVLYSAMRMIKPAPPSGFITLLPVEGGDIEIYGESESRAIYSAALPLSAERATSVASSELRLEEAPEPTPISELLPKPALFPPDHDPASPEFAASSLAYAAGLAGACPWLALEGNLLPAERRRGTSRARLIPTVALSSILLILAGSLAAHSSYADSRYLALLQHEIQRIEPRARQAARLDEETMAVRSRTQSLEDFGRRVRLDMDTLAELNKLIPPPGWVTSLEVDRNNVAIAGEVEQAATLLKTLDGSPLLEKSEFTMPIARGAAGEMFRVRAARQVPPIVPALPNGGAK